MSIPTDQLLAEYMEKFGKKLNEQESRTGDELFMWLKEKLTTHPKTLREQIKTSFDNGCMVGHNSEELDELSTAINKLADIDLGACSSLLDWVVTDNKVLLKELMFELLVSDTSKVKYSAINALYYLAENIDIERINAAERLEKTEPNKFMLRDLQKYIQEKL